MSNKIRCPAPLNIVEKCVWQAFCKKRWAWSDTTQSMTGGRDISDQNVTLIFFKMGTSGHFGCPKFIFVCISCHFRSKRNFIFLCSKWPPAAILDVQNSFSFAFLAISGKNETFFFQNGRRWSFWMSEIHFCLLFSPFSFAFHYLRCMMNLSMRTGEHEVVPVKPNMLKKSKCFATLGKGQLNVKVKN